MNIFPDEVIERHRIHIVLMAGVGLYFFTNFQRVGIPGAVFDVLQADYDMRAGQVAALGAAFMYIYALGQLVAGYCIDRFGGIRTMSAGGILFCAGVVLFPLSHSVPMLYFSRFLTGLGASSIYLSMVSEILKAFPGNDTVMVGLLILIGYSGGIAATAPFTCAVANFGLVPVLLAAAVLAVCFYLVFMLNGRKVPKNPVADIPLNFANYGKVLKVRHNRRLFLFTACNFGLYYVLQTVIGKKFLEDCCHTPVITAAWVLSVMNALSAVGGIVLAVCSRLAGNRRRPFCRLAGTVCAGVFLLMTGLQMLGIRSSLMMIPMCLLALTASTGAIIIPLLKETNQSDITGASIAFMNFLSYAAVALFGNLTGWLLEVFPPERQENLIIYSDKAYLLVFSVLSVFAVICCLASWQLAETMGKSCRQQ